MRKTLLKWGQRLVGYSNRWWYGPFISFIAAIDAYLIFISVEAILFTSVWARPKKWFSTALWLVFGSALGATTLALLISHYGEDLVRHFFPHLLDSKKWDHTLAFIDQRGAWGLALVAFSPIPQHLAVAVAGLAHMKIWTVFFALVAGRGAKYIPLAWLATHAPRILKKLHILPEDPQEHIALTVKKASDPLPEKT